ncbi:MAG: PqqD family protein [Vicinamibacterales bacterium]
MDQELERGTVVRWSSEQIAAPVGNDIVIMSVDRGHYYGLRDIAGEIWQRLEQPTSVDDVCRALVAKYDAAEDVIVPQVLSFLKELRQESLITIVAKRNA